jgi:hypothetical protein
MRKIALAVLGLATVGSLLYFPRRGSAQASTAVIEIGGAKLHLGMSKGEVTDALAGNEITRQLKTTGWLGRVAK